MTGQNTLTKSPKTNLSGIEQKIQSIKHGLSRINPAENIRGAICFLRFEYEKIISSAYSQETALERFGTLSGVKNLEEQTLYHYIGAHPTQAIERGSDLAWAYEQLGFPVYR